MSGTAAPLLPALLTDLVGLLPDQREAIEELSRRLGERRLRLLVVGEAKRGKSSLINALVGRSLLPVGVVPLTSVPTVLRYGRQDRLTVQLVDGSSCEQPLDELRDYVTEAANPGNARGIAEVTVELPAPVLASGLELVDTPGVGSVYEHNTVDANRALDRMDAAILVLSADPPMSASERQFLRAVRKQAVTVLCVLNKVDRLDPAELAEAVAFTENILWEELGASAKVWPLSARSGMDSLHTPAPGAPDGLAAFTAHLRRYLGERQADDLVQSVQTRARRLADEARASTELTLSALSTTADQLDQRLRTHERQLTAVRRQQADNAAVITGRTGSLLTALNDSARDVLREKTLQVQAVARDRATAARTAERASDTETAALEAAAASIGRLVEAWEREQRQLLERDLAALRQRLTDVVQEQVAAVRTHAGDLFQVAIPHLEEVLPRSAPELRSPGVDDAPGNTTAMLAMVRHRVPGRLGRRRVAAHVTERAGQLLDQHIGRSRARLQRELRVAAARMAHDLDEQASAGVRLVATALSEAQALHGGQLPEREAGRARLERRRAALNVLLAELMSVTPGRQ